MAGKKSNDKTGAVAGQSANVVALEDTQRELERRKGPADPPPHMARNGIAPQQWPGTPPNWTPNALGLPTEAPCPVTPVGFEGELFHFIDSTKQFRSVTAADLSHAGIQSLFAATPNYPAWAWPRHGRARQDKEGNPVPPPIQSFKDDDVRQALMLGCTREGLFSPTDKLRGRGSWAMRGGKLVYHAGEELWLCEPDRDGRDKFVRLQTGMHHGHLYPRLPALPAPWTQPIGLTELRASVGTLLKTFRCWNFERPLVDPILLLGWCGVAYLGGALDWRSAMLLLGGFGTGKSTLQKGMQALFGEHLMPSSDTTGPAIAQSLKQDTRAVACDELEAEADTRKVDAIVALMRAAASGDFRRRGSSDQKAVETHLRSAFLFSAINNPIQRPQDLSRVAILRLRELEPNQVRPDPIDADTCGRIVLARLMSRWPAFQDRLDEYKKALAAGGHVARGQDTYGTLLACADLLLGEELAGELEVPLTEDLAFWTRELASSNLPETEDALPNWAACVRHIMTVQLPNWRQGRHPTVGQIIEKLEHNSDPNFNINTARAELADAGLGLCVPGEMSGDVKDGYVLAVPNVHPIVSQLFNGTVWAGSPGAGGPWKDALRQAPAGVVITNREIKYTIGGVRSRCTFVVLKKAEER